MRMASPMRTRIVTCKASLHQADPVPLPKEHNPIEKGLQHGVHESAHEQPVVGEAEHHHVLGRSTCESYLQVSPQFCVVRAILLVFPGNPRFACRAILACSRLLEVRPRRCHHVFWAGLILSN